MRALLQMTMETEETTERLRAAIVPRWIFSPAIGLSTYHSRGRNITSDCLWSSDIAPEVLAIHPRGRLAGRGQGGHISTIKEWHVSI
jgi:hypothetical protein